MKKSEASRTFWLAGGLVEKLGEGCRSKQETKNEKRGAVLMRSSENPPQLNKIPKIKKENAVVCGDCICNLIRNLVDGVAVRSVLFCGCGCGCGCTTAQHSTAQRSTAQHSTTLWLRYNATVSEEAVSG